MKNFAECKNCGDWDFLVTHKCNPEFQIVHEEYMGDETKRIHAYDHQSAAQKYAEHYNTSNDYCLMNENIKIEVVKDGLRKKFMIGAEPAVHYSAKEIISLKQPLNF